MSGRWERAEWTLLVIGVVWLAVMVVLIGRGV